MAKRSLTRLSLTEARQRKDRGDVYVDPLAPEGPTFDAEFWAEAEIVEPPGPTAVLLKLDPEVIDYFKQGGRGHITRMQNVLRAYVDARKRQTAG